MPTEEKRDRVLLEVGTDYPSVDPVLRFLHQVEGTLEDQEFGKEVTLRASLPRERLDEFSIGLAGITRGMAALRLIGDEKGIG
jgi:putative IMPACT (imprinted ancient) family translation regulator